MNREGAVSENWRTWSEFQPAAGTGEEQQASGWITATLRQTSVADRVIERLLYDLPQTALTAATQSALVQAPISCQILVPADWRPGGCGSKDWAYFLVTRTAGRPDLDHDNQRVIQVFLFPAARG